MTVLSPSLVDKLGGTPAGILTGFRLTGERIDLQLFIIPEFRIGPMVQHHVVVAEWVGLDNLHLSGILALSSFRTQPITLDFKHHQLIFETKASLANRRASSKIVPVHFDDQRGIGLTPFAGFLAGSQTAECEIDTGSQGYILNSRYMKPLGVDPNSDVVKSSEHTTILGNKELRYSAIVPAPHLSDIPFGKDEVARALFEDIIYDCNIGIDYWANRVVTFDVPHKGLIVSTK